MSGGDGQFLACLELLRGLVSGGLRHLVVSPGSRNTPLLLAAQSFRGLRIHSVVHEASAAFLALGMARVHPGSAGLLCTSGSALGHYLPAIMEAKAAGLALVVLTADRPQHLQQCGASQTADQVKLYGNQVKNYLELSYPTGEEQVLKAALRLGAQAQFMALSGFPGPVQVNVKLQKPLEPTQTHRGSGLTAPRFFVSQKELSKEGLKILYEQVSQARRGLIICGPEQPGAERETAHRLSRQLGYPLVSEATHPARLDQGAMTHISTPDLVFRGLEDLPQFQPQLVLRLGEAPVSAALQRCSALQNVETWVIHPGQYSSPESTANYLEGSLESLERSLREFPALPEDTQWGELWQQRQKAAEACLDKFVPEDDGELGLLDTFFSASTTEDLYLGNSLAVRHANLLLATRCKLKRVFHQRGLAGIDGLVAGALGLQRATQKPLQLLLGDISLRHDLGALTIEGAQQQQLRIVVINNGGGQIFRQLPIEQHLQGQPQNLAMLTTPRSQSLGALSEAFAFKYQKIEDKQQLSEALSQPIERLELLELIVPDTSAKEGLAQLHQLWAQFAQEEANQ